MMIDRLGLAANLAQKIVIVGCGYGWVIEKLLEMGFTNVAGTDTSSYIQGTKTQTEDAEIDAAIAAAGLDPTQGEGLALRQKILPAVARSKVPDKVLNEDMANNASRNRIKNAVGGGTIAWGISDSVLESLTDSECVTASSRAHQICTNVAHLVVTARDGNHPGYNWKTLEQWKTLIPADTFIQVGGAWRSL